MKKIQVLGTGCPKCQSLYDAAQKAVAENNIEAEVVKIEDLNEILKFGVMITPALAVDGNVLVSGRVPSDDELSKLLA